VGNLLAGHYRITNRCAVLHITATEFGEWIARKEIFRRIVELKRVVPEPVVIVEGKKPADAPGPSPDAVRGALAFVAVHNRVPVLFSVTPKETADLIYAMANQIQNGMGEGVESPVTVEGIPAGREGDNGNGRPATLKPWEQIMQLVPEVGPKTAQAMLQRFESLRGVFSASAKELTKIEGLGPRKAKKIAAFFEHKCR
jgi:Fanconi anemia group M protein